MAKSNVLPIQVLRRKREKELARVLSEKKAKEAERKRELAERAFLDKEIRPAGLWIRDFLAKIRKADPHYHEIFVASHGFYRKRAETAGPIAKRLKKSEASVKKIIEILNRQFAAFIIQEEKKFLGAKVKSLAKARERKARA